MTRTPTRLIVALLLVLVSAIPAAGQTFNETIVAQDFYVFTSDAGGQYEVTVTWENPASIIGIFLFCGADVDLAGLSVGERDRTARLSVGIPGSQICNVIPSLVAGPPTDYTLNFQGTDTTDVTKLAASEVLTEVPATTRTKIDQAIADLRFLQAEAEERDIEKGTSPGPVGPTRTFLEQIQGGVPKSFFIDVNDPGLVQITAMWNRGDTNLRVSMICRTGMAEMDWGFSESRQERTLRFDADVISGTTCEITLESPRLMVFALNIAFLDNAGLLPSI